MARATNHELELIKEVRERIEDLNLDEEYLSAKNLVRFLRARNENLDQVEQMIRKTISWREELEVDSVLSYVPPPDFKENFPWATVGFDNLGGPLVILPIGLWSPSAVTGRMEEFIRKSIQNFEVVWNIMKIQSKGRDHIPEFTIVLDLQGLGWRHYTSYDCLQGTLTMVKYFEANYPETIRFGVFLNAPSIFGLFWKLIKPIVSPSTHEKLAFLGSNKKLWRETLIKYADPSQIPIAYGGTLSDSYQVNWKKLIEGHKFGAQLNGNATINSN